MSKSIAQRVIVAALLARGTTEIEGLPTSSDVLYAIRSARAAGATFPSKDRSDDLLETALVSRRGFGRLVGAPPRDPREKARPWATVPVGESGTAARLFTAAVSLARPEGSGAEIVPSGSLLHRSSPALFNALRAAGVGVEHSAKGVPASADAPAPSWPVLVTAARPPALVELDRPSSSQEVSALLMALAAHPEERRLRVIGKIPSRGYVDVTVATLKSFGAYVHTQPFQSDDDPSGGELFTIQGPLSSPDHPVAIEADASAAAVALAAGALSGGEAVWVPDVGTRSRQPDAAIAKALAEFGCDTSRSSKEHLHCQGAPTRGAAVDCGATPDIAPVLAAVGAFAALHGMGDTKLTGLETLPGKESSRIEVLAGGLRAVGLRVDHDDRSLHVHSLAAAPDKDHPRPDGPLVLDAHGDHRMAFAFALLSLFIPEVVVTGADSVSKSWPTFWTTLARSGAVPTDA